MGERHDDPTAHFQNGAAAYARHRPDYPPTLASELARHAPDRALALDLGCGTGQLTVLLADPFEAVLGIDVSADQIANATPHPRVRYRIGSADATGVEDGSVSLLAVAQAAHWFDQGPFHQEVRRVLQPGGVVALITYGVTQLDGPARARFDRFYWEESRPHWAPERRHVENGYAELPFPFEELEPPKLAIERQWDLAALLGYVQTWSAVKHARDAGETGMLTRFEADLTAAWGDPTRQDSITWPISIRLGRV